MCVKDFVTAFSFKKCYKHKVFVLCRCVTQYWVFSSWDSLFRHAFACWTCFSPFYEISRENWCTSDIGIFPMIVMSWFIGVHRAGVSPVSMFSQSSSATQSTVSPLWLDLRADGTLRERDCQTLSEFFTVLHSLSQLHVARVAWALVTKHNLTKHLWIRFVVL